MKKPIYDKGIIIWYEDDDILEEVSEEISEGSTPEEIAEEVIDEVTDNVEDQIEVETWKDVDLEVVTTTEPTEQIPSQEEFEINNTDNSIPNSSEEVKEWLDDLVTLLKDTL